MNTIKVVIVSTPGTWEKMLLNSIEAHPSVEVAAIAHGGISALQLTKEYQPGFVFIDASIPIDETEAIIEGIKRESEHTQTIVLADTSKQRRLLAGSGAAYVLATFDYASRLGVIFEGYRQKLTETK